LFHPKIGITCWIQWSPPIQVRNKTPLFGFYSLTPYRVKL
jgi:hypothetical protein